MDATSFLGHVKTRRALAVAPEPVSAPPEKKSGAKPKGDPDLGKPPYGRGRYPAGFTGRKVGSKNVAGKKRELLASLSGAVVGANVHLSKHPALGRPDFLNQFVTKNALARIMTKLRNPNGAFSIGDGVNELSRLSRGQLYPMPGVSSTVTGGGNFVGGTSSAYQPGGEGQIIAVSEIPSTVNEGAPAVSDMPDLIDALHGEDDDGGVVVPETSAFADEPVPPTETLMEKLSRVRAEKRARLEAENLK